MFPRFNTFSVSNILIGISLIATIAVMLFPELYRFGMNDAFLNRGIYHIFIIQIFTSMFLHGGVMHVVFNSVFVYLFGNQVENLLGTTRYVIFFIFTAVLTGVGLTALDAGNTVGISSFCLAVLTYYTLALWQRGNIEYKGGITAIIVNLAIGFYPGISFAGHAFGCVAGVLFFLITSNLIGKMMQPLGE